MLLKEDPQNVKMKVLKSIAMTSVARALNMPLT